MLILGIGMWVIGIPAAIVMRERPEEAGDLPQTEEFRQVSEPSQGRTDVPVFRYAKILKQKTFLYVNLAEMIRLMALMAVVTHIMPYLSSVEISRMTSGLMAAGVPLLSIAGRFGFGWLGDIYPKKFIMAFCVALMALGMLTLCYLKIAGMIYIFLIFFSNGFGGITTLRASLLREYYGRYNFGKYLGIMLGFGAGGGIIGPTTAGWVFDTTASFYYVWLTLSALIGLAILLILKIEPKAKPM